MQKWNLISIQKLVDEREQEGPYLEYKSSAALGNKNEISKDISAFANAGGGTIIYGIVEDGNNNFPERIDEGVNPDEKSKEWLEQVINSRIHRQIEGIEIFQISLENGNVIYALNIPQSERAPHQASSKKFYTRRNFLSESMEEYEIRDVLMREKAPNVILDFYFRRHGARIEKFPLSLKNPETKHGVEINASLRNDGGGEVNYAVIRLFFDARMKPKLNPDIVECSSQTMIINGIDVGTIRADIKWGGSSKMPLFKTIEFLFMDEDINIHFKSPWLKEENSPFIMWEIRAPGMEPNQGFLRLKLYGHELILQSEVVPEISEIYHDGWNRDFLKNSDLSFNSTIK